MSHSKNRSSEISLAVDNKVDNNNSLFFHTYPLSSPQEVIWLDQVIHSDSPKYNIGLFTCIAGELNEALFAHAFKTLVSRHDTLRLQLINTHALPRQKIDVTLPVSVAIHDFSSHLDAETQARQHIDAEFMRPFNLDGELWRAEILRVSNTRRYWQFCCHHLIMDGSSLFMLLGEVINAYNQLVRKEALNETAPSYLDFIADDRAYFASQRYSHDLQFWGKRYENLPQPLLLPASSNKTENGGQAKPLFWQIDKALFQRINETVTQQGLSILHFMYAVLAGYFARTTEADEIVIGIPVHNRKNARQKSTMGMFASIIPIGVTVSLTDTFLDIMHKAETELRRCYKHQRLPVAEISRQAQIQQKTGRAQLFDMTLSLEPFKTNLHMEGEDTRIERFDLYHGAPYPLSVIIKQYTDTAYLEDDCHPITIEFNFSTDYLSTTEVMTLQSRLAVLLDAAITAPDTPIANLPILPEAERQQILVDFNATQADFPQNALIHQLFEAQVQQNPDAIAVVFEDQSLSYDELNHHANRLAHHLIGLGVRPDDRVAICVERSLDMVVGLLGILKAGGAYVPLDPTYPTERLAYMLNDSAPMALITQAALVETLGSNLPIHNRPIGKLPTIVLNAQERSVLDEKSEENPDTQALGLAPHHLAYVIYTSGSTGQPKGVMVEHHSLCNLIATQQDTLSLTPDSRVLQFVSNSFDACIWECCMALLAGSRLHLTKRANILPGVALSRYLETSAITHTFLSPTALAAMDSIPDTLQILIVGSETCSSTLVKRWAQGRQMINAYGPTEIAVCATLYPCDSQAKNAPPIGRPIANTQIYLLDAHSQPVPIGVMGEIYIGGVGVARGYLNRPELTAERFLPDPFSTVAGARMYKTGDLARWLPDGNIEYIGRNDFQVKLRGFRIELGEIEARLTQCHGVREAVVVAREDISDQKRLVAYLLAEPNTELVPAELRQQLSQQLAEYMIPSAFVTLGTFPLTPNGKLDRQALPEPDQAAIVTRGYEAPVSKAETALARIWQTLLGLDNIGRHDHFFELGGHSLMAVNLIERLHSLGWVLDIHTVFATPVLTEMAKAMLAAKDNTATFTVPPNLIPDGCTAITPDMLTLVSLSQNEIDTIAAAIPDGDANIQDIYPLAPLQEGILFHHLLQTQGDAYLLRNLFAFDTRERLDAFLAALQQVINRHDILRTAACWQGLAKPVQVVWRQAPLCINTFVPEGEQNVFPQLLAHTDPYQRRLDVSQAPLFSADIAHDPHQNEWLLALCFHHLVSDHMTLEFIIAEIRELMHCYVENSHTKNKRAENLCIEKLPAALPYRNFIAQSLRVAASEHETYFREVLADINAPTAPFGILDVLSGDRQIMEVTQSIDTTLAKAIRMQARRQGVSPSVLFHVAWAQVLAHTSGRDDVVFGTVLLGRMQGNIGIERVLGLFINTLPVRIRLAENSVQATVQAAYRGLMGLLEHEQAPLALAQRCSGVAPSLPLFSALLNYRHSQPDAIHIAWEGIRLLAVQERTNYPLTLSVDDLGEGFSLVAQAVSGIDPTRLIAYMTAALTGLVEALNTEPQRPIMLIPILPATERQQLLVDFNATQADFPQDTLIHQLFEAQVQHHPDAIAVVFDKQSLSYDELNRRANRLAHHLIALGVRPDDRVALCVERSLAMVVGLLGILKAGGAYVPLDPTYPAERLAYMLEDATPKIVLTQMTLVDPLACSVPTVVLDNPAPFLDAMQPDNPDSQAQGLTSHHLAYVIYTSGSTGLPKGVAIEHRNTVNFLTWAQQTFCPEELAHTLFATSLNFDLAVYECFAPLISGGTVHLVPNALSLTSTKQAVSLINTVPSAIAHLIDTNAIPAAARTVNLAGEALKPHIVGQLFTRTSVQDICNLYGPSETTTYSTWVRMNRTTGFTPHIGRPIANTQIYILNTDGQPAPLGVAGEIHIAGAGVARGYLNRPELTAERFLPDPFSGIQETRMYKTGDLGRWLPDGNIEYLGRNDFQVKIRGFRIELGEIEAQLVQCHGVREAVVLAREDISDENNSDKNNSDENSSAENRPGQKQLVAYLLPQAGVELEPAELRQQLAQHLTEYMLPSAFVTLNAFPLTPNGKLDRQALPAPDQSAIATRGYAAPIGNTEMALAEIWQELLRLEKVGRNDHFFELGGHSLLAVQLAARIRQKLARELSLPQLFAHPVLTDLATVLINASVATLTAIPAADRRQPLPLSFAQQRLWFLAQLDPAASLAYHIPAVLRLSGQLDHSALTTALDRLVTRHESLRTRFILVDEQPYQNIDAADIGFNLTRQDLRGLDETSRITRIDKLVELETRTPFDFAKESLVRGQLLQLADEEHVLILTQHHIITDGWSVGILIRELGALYRAALEKHDDPLPSLPIQYADYAIWQQEWLRGEVLTAQRSFWQQQLQGAPALLDLHTDRPRPPEQHYTGSHVPVHLDADLLTALRSLGQRQGTTLFMTLLAAWGIVLARLSGQDDIVIGTPVANRQRSELEGLIGLFVNTLPLRVELENCNTVAELLAHVRERALAAYAHQDLPFEQLVKALQPHRSLSYSPIFQVMLALDNTPAQAFELPGLSVSLMEQAHRSAHFDLTLSLTETLNGLGGYLEYASDLFDRATVERMVSYLTNVLTSMAADETQAIARLPILSVAGRQQLLIDFNPAQAGFPHNALTHQVFIHQLFIHQLFEAQVQRTPDATAVVFEDQSLSYQELNHRANQLAHSLIAFGIRPDDRVAICVDRGLDMIIGLFGILKAGAGYIPLDPEYPTERLVYQLSDSKPAILLTQKHLQQHLQQHLQTCLPIQDLPIWLLDDEIHQNSMAKQPAHNPDSKQMGLQPHHLAYIIYTSGSTGRPKGVMLEHHNVVSLIHAQCQISKPQLGDRILQFVTVAFDISVSDIFPTLASGATLVLRPSHIKIPDITFVDFLREQKVTIINIPTAFWHHWVQEIVAGRGGFSPYLHTVIVGGDKVEHRYLMDWLSCPETQSCRWFNAYGPTEVTVTATAMLIDSKHTSTITDNIPIGHPLSNTRIYILDTLGQPVPIGVSGEIHIGGMGIARGYSNQPELTAEKFIVDPFSDRPNARMYKTGDLGRWRPDGNIEYLGRNDFQVKIRGFRIELGEIEARLVQCHGVREAIVLAREFLPHQSITAKEISGEKRLVAYLLAEPNVELVPAELRQQLAQHLADYMLPSAFVTLDAFPLAPNGKLDRKALPMPDQTAIVTRAYEAPTTDMEIALAKIWQALLGLEKVSRYDHFFELGGHSLMVVHLIERLRNQGHGLDIRTVFSTPVLAEMAKAMLTAQDNAATFSVPPNLIPDGCTAITPDMLPLICLTQHEIDTIAATLSGGAANIQDIYPLAPLQEGMLFHHLLQTQGDIYLLHILLAFDTRERLDAFLAAFQQVINRHDILRTAVCWQGLTKPVQIVWRQASLHVNTFVPDSDKDVPSQLLAHTDPYQRRLNVSQAPLFSADIAHDPHQGEWLLALCCHHMLNDHMSLDMIITEIYELLHHRTGHLAPVATYRHFIAQSLRVPTSDHEAYFREALADVDAPTAPYGILDVYSGDRQVTEIIKRLNAKLARAIRAQARRQGVSPGVLFHVAWALVLAKLSERDDVVFGTVLLGRMQGGTDINRIPGLFINTLPVRLQLAGNSAQETVQAAYRSLTQLLEHEQAPLALAQRCSSVVPPLPLFTALLNYRHSQSDATRNTWEGIRLITAQERTNYPLYLAVDDLGKGFRLAAQTVPGIDPTRLIAYMTTALANLVKALETEPQRPIVNLSILPDTEHPQWLIHPDDKLDRQAPPASASSAVAITTHNYEAPIGDVETTLAQIWQKLLKLEQVGRHDNFFKLGGHSLIAIQLLARMREQNMEMPLSALFIHPTLCELALAVGDTSMFHPDGTHHTIIPSPSPNQMADSITGLSLPTSHYDPLVALQSGSQTHSPLFCMPGAGASASSLLELALSFPSSLPVYVLQSRGLTNPQLPPYVSVEEAARDYLKTIRQTQPKGPYHLLGHSFGGWIAFEIALQLQAQGEQVADLILIDTEAPTPQGCKPESFNRIGTLMELINIYNMMLRQPLPLTQQDFEGQDHSEQLQYLHQALVSSRLFTANSPISLLQGIVQVMHANLNTCYTPRTNYDGRVHLINAKEENIDEAQAHARQWKTYVTELSMMRVSGNHITMLSIPNVEPFIAALWQELNYPKG
ncbi:amino acid adenylation domain-containing protein [Xenorhabdus sp. VLS]|uniref:Amino acid adenylation domain-containing protein n=2 Tax=Xenorhabdus lircayensis TaxID=2763499 RepID=A0ABS0U515_9GAMM|nr:non-ribosomal peptide synthetase [Xenorhabdus lircayensis]MBI6548982.1 amino acid adenylation domain-containing protein [Xenorhabdus lircayensis]